MKCAYTPTTPIFLAAFFSISLAVFVLPTSARAATVWRSTPAHNDEVKIYTPEFAPNYWYGGTAKSSYIKIGAWNQPDFTTTASTSARIWSRWNGYLSPTLIVFLYATLGGKDSLRSENITAGIVTQPYGYYPLPVYATSTVAEYVVPVDKNSIVRQGQDLWLGLHSSWGGYGTDHWVGSSGSLPYFEICEGACDGDTPPPPPPDPCVAANTCVSNVLFLPGIEASRLYRPGDLFGTDQLWEPNTDNDGDDLLLSTEGKSVRNDIYTRDVVDEAYVSGVGMNIYKSFINQMNGLKAEKVIADWEAIPYDWRLSFGDILSSGNQLPDGRIYYAGSAAATSSPYVIQELRRLAASSKTGKVTIVAHSNGGLLTKALIQKLGDTEAAKLIDKIVFVAVPQAGTPQAVGALLHGYEQGLPRDWLSLFLTPETARTLALNMPSVYNLLPSANYFTYVDDPAVTFDDSDILSEFRSRYGSSIHDGALLKSFVTDTSRTTLSSPSDLKYPSVGNGALYSLAETLHNTIDTWAPPQGVKLYEVAGWGEDTLATIEYKEGKKAYCSNLSDVRTCTVSPTITYSPKEVVEGDGTVLVPSALWSPASTGVQKYWVDLRKYNKFTPSFFGTKHADILEIQELRTLVQNILTNATTTPFTFITTTQPTATDSDTRLRFLLHSPLDLSATDSLGNIVSSATSTISGARWRRYGEVQVLTVPENTPITLNLDGYAAGSFTLDIEEVDGSNVVVASSTLSAIPSTEDTRASMVFTDGTLQGASPLLLDYDGNGTTDVSIKSEIGKEVVFDTTPPEAVVTFDPVSQQIVVVGSDNLSSTTVVTTVTSSLITDEAGNTLEILFKKFKKEGKESKVEIQGLKYNGVLVGEVSKTVLQYEWSVDKTGKLKELQEKATVKPLTVEGHYDAKKNVTRIEKEKDLPGLAIVGFKTDKGLISITY